MAAEFICDHCGKREPAVHYPGSLSSWHKPPLWYQRNDDDGVQDACCPECIEEIAKKTGKTAVRIPL